MIIFAIITEPVLRYLSLIVEWISARCRMIHARFFEGVKVGLVLACI